MKNICKKTLVIGIIFLFVGVYIPSTGRVMEQSSILSSDSNTLYVGGSGEGNYSKIKDAIDNASNGDTVFVYNGTYYENIEVDKSISLVGEDKNITIIDGDYVKNHVLYLLDDNITVNGFTIRYAGIYKDGILIRSSGNHVLNCKLLANDWCGVALSSDCNNNLISHCEVSENFGGIYVQGWEEKYDFNNVISHCTFGPGDDVDLGRVKNTVVTDCTFYESDITQDMGYGSTYSNCVFNNPNTGIVFWDGAEDVSIVNCTFLNCSIDGIVVANAFMNNLTVQNCYFENCGMNGIVFGGYLEGCLISDCKFFNSTYNGIYFTTWMGKVEVTRCHFEGNDFGIEMDFRNWYNKFTKNNFINNNYHVWWGWYYVMLNYYNENYWDDWRGFGPYRVFYRSFRILSFLSWDWHPAKAPYDIGG